ncbi:MAG: polysaccharide deacetylase family protein [Paenibacillus sp.]|jgi:peptidoglycan/xylan/chitin deacetylase (PgdA/CDA1 family)|nr:polysaccharide deacetylase family protein [Paenibacillus sp.]
MFSDQVAVLMYHHIDDTDGSSGTITTQLFRDQLTYLRDKGYSFISQQDFHQFMEGAAVPDNAVMVTFDDGYESFYTHAYPVLTEMNVPAVNFIITETLNDPTGHNIPFMSRDQIRDMTMRSDLIQAECHTNSLHHKDERNQAFLTSRLMWNNTLETEEIYKERILNDTSFCLQEVEDITGKGVQDLAYPFGIYSKQASELLQQAGVRYAFTIVPEMATRQVNRMQIPRINGGSPFITPERLHQTILRSAQAK